MLIYNIMFSCHKRYRNTIHISIYISLTQKPDNGNRHNRINSSIQNSGTCKFKKSILGTFCLNFKKIKKMRFPFITMCL